MQTVEQQQNALNSAGASRETVLTTASPAITAASLNNGGVGGGHSTFGSNPHIYNNRLSSEPFYPAGSESPPIMSHRDLIARSGLAQQHQYSTLQHHQRPGYYSPQLGGAGHHQRSSAFVSSDPNGGYANLQQQQQQHQGSTLPRHPMLSSQDWRGSGGYLAQAPRVPPISEESNLNPSDLGLPHPAIQHQFHHRQQLNPDRVFSPIRESNPNLSASSPSARLPNYQETLSRNPQLAHIQQRGRGGDNGSINAVGIGFSTNASAAPQQQVVGGRAQQQQQVPQPQQQVPLMSPSTTASCSSDQVY